MLRFTTFNACNEMSVFCLHISLSLHSIRTFSMLCKLRTVNASKFGHEGVVPLLSIFSGAVNVPTCVWYYVYRLAFLSTGFSHWACSLVRFSWLDRFVCWIQWLTFGVLLLVSSYLLYKSHRGMEKPPPLAMIVTLRCRCNSFLLVLHLFCGSLFFFIRHHDL